MEETTKPLIEDMVWGNPRTLTPFDQRRLAAWIVKTTMTAEFLYPKEVAITQTEREKFRLMPEPGPHWQIWVAFYTGTKQIAGGIFHHGVGLYPLPLPMRVGIKNTQFTVLGLGRMLVLNVSSEQDILTFHLRPEADIALKRLWPPSDIDLTGQGGLHGGISLT